MHPVEKIKAPMQCYPSPPKRLGDRHSARRKYLAGRW